MARTQYVETLAAADAGTGIMRTLAGVAVTVTLRGQDTLAHIYTDPVLDAEITDQIITGDDGLVKFWADIGAYDIHFTDTIVPRRVIDWSVGWDSSPMQPQALPGSLLQDASVLESKLVALLGTSFVDALMERFYAPGDLKLSYQAADHAGWLLCDGRKTLDSNAYPDLSALMLAVPIVGDVAGHFGIPDYRGRVPVGADPTGVRIPNNPRTLGATGGEERHLLSGPESGANANARTTDVNNFISVWDEFDNPDDTNHQYNHLKQFWGGNAWGGGMFNGSGHFHGLVARNADNAHQNMQPYQTGNWFIKT